MCVAPGGADQQVLEPTVEHERGDGVDQLGLQQLHRRHLVEHQPPRVPAAQVDLLQILVEATVGEEALGVLTVVGEQPQLRQLGRVRDAGRVDRPVGLHQVGAAHAVVVAEQLTRPVGHRRRRRRFQIEHVSIELGRPPDRLAGVVDDVVETVVRVGHMGAERLDTRRVPQVEAVHLDPIGPVLEIMLSGESHRRITWEPCRDDEASARPQQLETRLVADLDPTAREQRRPAAEIGALGALEEVEVTAAHAELVVEVVDLGVLLLAHVAVSSVGAIGRRRVALGRSQFEPGGHDGCVHVRRVEHGTLAALTDAGPCEDHLLSRDLLHLLATTLLLEMAAAGVGVGVEHVARGGE